VQIWDRVTANQVYIPRPLPVSPQDYLRQLILLDPYAGKRLRRYIMILTENAFEIAPAEKYGV
jgi:hypothetical protein